MNKKSIIFIFIILLITIFYNIENVNCGEEDIEEIYFDDGANEFLFISDTELPTKLNNIKAKKIFASAYQSALIDDNDELYHWGLYSNIVSEVPNLIKVKDNKIRDASLGGNFIVMVTKDNNELYSMGKSKYGVLGNSYSDEDEVEDTPKKILFKLNDDDMIESISNGYEHSLLVTSNDGIYGWGRNHKFQLGLEKRKDKDQVLLSMEEEYYSKPIKVIKEIDPIYKDLKKLCSGSDHNLLLNNDGSIYSWGNGYFGALGHGNKDNQSTPKKIQIDISNNWSNSTKIVDIACGGYHSMFLTNTNEIYTFGSGELGQLGHGENDTINHYTPKRIAETGDNFGGNKINSIHAGDHGNSFYITTNGDVYSWGWGDSGALGHGTNENKYKPQKINTLSNIKQIVAGFKHTIALSTDNDVYVFGDNTYGQSGLKHNNEHHHYNEEEEEEEQQKQYEQKDIDNFNNILNLI